MERIRSEDTSDEGISEEEVMRTLQPATGAAVVVGERDLAVNKEKANNERVCALCKNSAGEKSFFFHNVIVHLPNILLLSFDVFRSLPPPLLPLLLPLFEDMAETRSYTLFALVSTSTTTKRRRRM